MQFLIDTIGGLYELARQVCLTRGNLRGKYWSWRRYTAMGPGPTIPRHEHRRAMLEYGRWIWRLRRL